MTTRETTGFSLEIKRIIKASRARVYEAWTDPAQLREWFGPDNVKTRALVAEVKVDGKYRWDITKPDGEQMSVHGEYRELVPGRRVVFTWQWLDDEDWENRTSVVTVDLEDCEGGTELRLRHEEVPTKPSRDRHNEGWNLVLDRLETFFTE